MAGNSIGNIFKITSFGESHGILIGVIIDGCPAGLKINKELIQKELERRRPGQSELTTSRSEEDEVEILSGTFNNFTTGAPICLIVKNKDVDSSIYDRMKNYLRPSHADFSRLKRYGGFADYRGGGRFSGRITAGFVLAGSLAKQVLSLYNIEIVAYAIEIGGIRNNKKYDFNKIKILRSRSDVGVLDPEFSQKISQLILQMKNEKNSVGGIIKCIVNNFPAGVGDPIFNNLQSDISKAIFSIPAVKGIEFGIGFEAARMKGSEHNDPWIIEDGKIKTSKNDAGGILGGISTGMPIEFNVCFKPTASISKTQKTVNIRIMKEMDLSIAGRHDPCIVPRAIPIVESMTAIVLLDHLLLTQKIPLILEKQ
jgi:chorismate synthase